MKENPRRHLVSVAYQQARNHPATVGHALVRGASRYRARVRVARWAVVCAAGLLAVLLLAVHPGLNAAPASLVVTPPALTLDPGEQTRLVAEPVYPEGAVNWRPPAVHWASEIPAVADVSQDGTVVAGTPGTTTVTASQGEVTASARIDVVDTGVQLRDLDAQPPSVNLVVGENVFLSAVGAYSDGNIVDLTAFVTWIPEEQGIVAVEPGGRVIAIGPGSATITASYQGLTSPVTVLVSSAPTDTPTDTLRSTPTDTPTAEETTPPVIPIPQFQQRGG